MPERWIVMPRWEEFQHRDAARANVPTWLKTFTRLLSDDDYLSLTGHRRAILHGLWMEYARSLRQLTDNTASLSRRLSLKVTSRDLEALNDAGFIAFHASRPASNDASTLAGAEVEKRSTKPRAVHGPPQDPDAGDDEPDLDTAPGNANGTALGSHHPRTQIEQSLAHARGAQ